MEIAGYNFLCYIYEIVIVENIVNYLKLFMSYYIITISALHF
jgi:hypothetical protein